jgi:hypothetical protein
MDLIAEGSRDDAAVVPIASRAGFDDATTQAALRALRSADPPFFKAFHGALSTSISAVAGPTERARRAVGWWPTGQSLADRTIEAFEQAADKAATEEEAGRLRQLARGAGGIGRAVLVEVMTKVAMRSTGLEP